MGPQNIVTYFLPMTVSFLVRRIKKRTCISNISNSTKKHQAKKSIVRRLCLFFSKNTSQTEQESIKAILGVDMVKQHDKYLGLPFLIGQSKKQTCLEIKKRVWKKLQGCKEKLLSRAEKRSFDQSCCTCYSHLYYELL